MPRRPLLDELGTASPTENYLQKMKVTDTNGLVKFTSVYPACYSARWPHIHYEVYPCVHAITNY